jgi:hypothetical protein
MEIRLIELIIISVIVAIIDVCTALIISRFIVNAKMTFRNEFLTVTIAGIIVAIANVVLLIKIA